MINTLVFVNDNISYSFIQELKNKGAHVINFKIESQELTKPDFSIDAKISELIHNELEKVYDAIYLPFSLSLENYLEFLGLRIGLHIRLTEGPNVNTAIIVFGDETPYEVNKLNKTLGNVLFTSNIYITKKISVENFQKQLEFVRTQKKMFSIKDFAKQINVPKPASYETNHTVTNEWSILRWANVLGIKDQKIDKIEREVGSLLYFKYLRALYPPSKSAILEDYKFKNKGTVLYIDDEKDKGWEVIFEKIFKSDNLNFIAFGSELRTVERNSQAELINNYLQAVEITNPDVVLLDLRLHPDDFKESQTGKNLTGFEILEQIKIHNKGIQVIVISATNKIWNLQDLQEQKVDGFIMKESPEQSVDENFSVESINNLLVRVDEALGMSFLKDIDKKSSKILDMIPEGKNNAFDFKESTKKNLFIAFELLQKTKNENKFFNYAYLQLFLIIEEFIKLDSVFIYGDECFVINDGKEIKVLELDDAKSDRNNKVYKSALSFNGNYHIGLSDYNRRIDTNLIVSSLLIFRFGFEDSNNLNWRKIRDDRNNKAAHPGDSKLITPKEIFEILDFLHLFLNENNINDKNVAKGLS